jgi:hypothetical protein
MSLEALFGESYCFFCDIQDCNRWDRKDSTNKRWEMMNPDEVPLGALLFIRRR